MDEQRTLTAPQVARLCGVDQKSIWNWCRAGKGPRHMKTPGGMARFRVESVARWMAQNEFRVPKDMRQYLDRKYLVKEELMAAVDEMDHADRESLLSEYKRWVEVRGA